MTTNHSDAREEIVWQGKFITAKVKGTWEYVSRSRGIRAAVIVAIDADDHVLLVEQYRVGPGKNCIELPAGLVGDEDGAEDEDVLAAAGRELEEETGYRAELLEDMGSYYSSPGWSVRASHWSAPAILPKSARAAVSRARISPFTACPALPCPISSRPNAAKVAVSTCVCSC